jgi:23S rRNA (guanosine2251-2'-O)-methyltransferase
MARGDPRVAVIEGVRPVIEALRAARRRVLRVSMPAEAGSPGLLELSRLLAERDIPVRRVSGARDVAAEAEPYPELPFEDLLVAPPPRWLVALDRVTDVGNLGSIARTAEVAGVWGLVLEHRHAPPIGAGALRARAGALEHLPVGRTPNLRRALELCRSEGLGVLVAEPGGQPLERVPPDLIRGDLVLVLGGEAEGTRAGVRALADELVGIPLRGRVGSLGVAAAGAYLLLRLADLRQRAGAAEWPGPGRALAAEGRRS